MLLKVLIVGLMVTGTGLFFGSVQKESLPLLPATPIIDSVPATLTFERDVLPVFQAHCNPCHFPGGKMYDKLPFDKAATILDHSEGILKRISDEEESKKIRQFVEENQSKEKS